MKSRSLLVACALTAAAFSFSAFSQESSVCSDPLQKICKDTVIQRAQRDVFINKIKKEIADEANVNAAPRIEQMKKEISKFRIFKRAIQAYKIRNQEIMKSAKKRIVGIETVVTDPANVSLLKKYMKTAINDSNFAPTTKVGMSNIVDSIVIGNFGDFLERTNLEDSVLSQMLANHCGSDGMVANAFATTLDRERYVLICPGFLITMSQEPDMKERFNTILLAISHEMGHHLDNSKLGNDMYRPFMSCLAENHVEKFNSTEDDKKFCKKNEKDPAACKMKIVESHAGELIADAWGIKVLNLHARAQNYSFAETDSLLVSTWAGLCGTGDEGIHPSGDFRIGTSLRSDPGIVEYLACGNAGATLSRPACTFDGAVNF